MTNISYIQEISTKIVLCPKCNGKGKDVMVSMQGGSIEPCKYCNNTGRVYEKVIHTEFQL